eukprot:COSAG04_NODE_11982_length_677_cov_1.074394_2_plen_129_part_01
MRVAVSLIGKVSPLDGNRARFGYCNDISGEDCCAGNAGWTNHFVDPTPNQGSGALKQAWIFVLPAATLTPDGWSVVLKTNGDSTLGYSSPLWGDDQTLHPETNPTEPGNAKYRYYLDLPFDAVMGCVGS